MNEFTLQFQDFNGKRQDVIKGMTTAGVAECLRAIADRIAKGEELDICVQFCDSEDGYTTLTNQAEGHFSPLP